VLLNLFQNAVEAMTEAEVKDRWIRVATRLRGATVELRVVDGGPGIPADMHSRIFEPWFTTKPGGHGFGLAVSYRIIKNHGGSIAVQNGGNGGNIRIQLPAHAGTTAVRAAA
jgi:C4-dicarboxylate-specific signal transduction histidine kinase